MTDDLAIEAHGIGRVFDQDRQRVVALENVDLCVRYGEVVGFLGPNGAGKTTLVKILSTLIRPSTGTVRVCGIDAVKDPRRARTVTSVIFGGDRGLYTRLTGRQNLRFFGMINGIERKALKRRISESLDQVGLEASADRRVETYSKGMRQRLHIAIGMLVEPRVLLLDEPTVGLDPTEAQRLRRTIGAMRDRGVSVLLTSHHLLDVERLADRVVLLQHGHIQYDLPLAEFCGQTASVAAIRVRGTGQPAIPDRPDLTVVDLVTEPAYWQATVHVRSWSSPAFVALGQMFADTEIVDLSVETVGLEDAYAALVRD